MALPFSPSLKPISVENCKPRHHHTPQFGFKPSPFYLRISASSFDPPSTARFTARRRESISVHQLQKPLSQYMSLPISYYSVLDGERVEKIDDNTFKCHVYRFNVFTYQICPVLLVRLDHQPNGCRINLLSCEDSLRDHQQWLHKATTLRNAYQSRHGCSGEAWRALDDSTVTNASMVNQISCDVIPGDSSIQLLTSDTVIEVSMKLPSTFFAIPVKTIESAGTKVLEQVLKVMLPRFMAQLVKDYTAWALEDSSRETLGAEMLPTHIVE